MNWGWAMGRFSFAVLLCLDLLLLGCGYSENGTIHGVPLQSQKIKHIVVIMQENRTFDNLFHGFPGADTVESGMSNGKLVALHPIRLEQGTDVDHSHLAWWKAWDNGRMDGFAQPNIPFLTCLMPMSPGRDGALLDPGPAIHAGGPDVSIQQRA